MYLSRKPNPEVQPKPERRRFNADYKRRIVIEADQCRHGEMGALLRREGLTYMQVATWRKAYHDGTLVNKPRGPQPDPNRAQVRRLEAENARLVRKLEQAEAIIDAQKKASKVAGQPEGRAIVTELAAKTGLKRACEVLGVPRSTVYRSRRPSPPPKPRPQPAHALSEAERAEIRQTLNSERFMDKSPRQV
jgi:transposase-like protein